MSVLPALRPERGNAHFAGSYSSRVLVELATLSLRGGSDEILPLELDTIWVRAFSPHGREASTIPALLKMAALRSPGDTDAYGVAPLREVLLDTAGDPTTLRVDLNAVLERWSDKIDMPRITCDRLKQSSRYMVL